MRPRTEHDWRIRDVRHPKRQSGVPTYVWHKCPHCLDRFTSRQWLAHEYECPSRPARVPKRIIVDLGWVKQIPFGKPPIKWHKCPFCKNRFTGRQWLAHSCQERNRKAKGSMWITPERLPS